MIRIAIVVLSALILSACIIPIPIGAIDSAINGSHCVSANAKVGDVVTDNLTGKQFKITEINTTSDGSPYHGCGARLPNRAKADLLNSGFIMPASNSPPSPYHKYLNVDIGEDLKMLGKPKEIKPGDGYDYYVWTIDGCDVTFMVSQSTHKVDADLSKTCP
jgi:hypothetical protein